MTCDTTVRRGFDSTQTGWNQQEAWNRQTSNSNAYTCYAASQGYGGDCYNWLTDPTNPFNIIATGWGYEYPDTRPLDPPEENSFDPVAFPPQTEWNSCAAYCSTIEDADYCFSNGSQCYAAKLKSGQSPSSIRTVAATPSSTSGCGEGDICTYTGGASIQAGTCTPRPPTATLTATPSTIAAGESSLLSWNSFNVNSCLGTAFVTGGAVSGSTNASPAATTDYRVDCTGGAGSAFATARVTVGTTAGTDLTAGGITPTTATLGSTKTLSGTVSNIASVAAGASQSYIQVNAPNSKASVAIAVNTPALAGGASSVASIDYKFSYEGYYSARVCADWYGAVSELNEENNCGPWTDIAVIDQPITSSVSCYASSQSVLTGQSVNYTASPVGAATSPYTWLGSDGATGFGSNATAVRTFTAPGVYGMQVSATYAASSAQCPLVSVAASWCTATTPNLTITANPTRVEAGDSVELEWSASGVLGENATCSVSGPGVSWTSGVSPAPVCSVEGTTTTIVNSQSTYTLTCGSDSASVTVNVIPNFEEF